MGEDETVQQGPPHMTDSRDGGLAVVTGTGGLGLEVAKKLAQSGIEVVIAGRNPAKGEDALSALRIVAPDTLSTFQQLDLADLSSIERFADHMLNIGRSIDILVNNAGIMSPPSWTPTVDDFEAQFGVNHLGHFALTGRLLPLLRLANAPRVINVTSLAHRYAKMNFDDLQSRAQYNPGKAYCQSKLAVALFSRELQRRSDEHKWGINSLAAHPGYASTNLFRGDRDRQSFLELLSRLVVLPLLGQSAEKGSAPLVHAATAPDIDAGALYGPTGMLEMKGRPGRCNFAKQALDENAAAKLWEVSEALTGVSFPR